MKLCNVTIYRRSADGFLKRVFDKAFVRKKEAIGFKNGGRYRSCDMTVRIFSPSDLAVKAGDMIELGNGGREPSENALTIYALSDNRDFSLPHTRISAR